MGNPKQLPLTSHELTSLSSIFSICCNESLNDYIRGKRNKTHPADLQPAGEKLEACTVATTLGVQKKCSKEYEAMKDCLSSNPSTWAKCKEIREALEKCAVKNKLGDIGK